ncbi:oxidoreductase [Danxiaibacter flavus]|uniref:Oxidoreductase n=1 Tax=Danxiaibacter flavus TaxID=3049108 RepID=A0ABV3ZMH6_9BACT|nr:oxidoreductase [Chitinophagaceae bacterium DXS]
MKKAILFGATGFIGSFLLQDLLNDESYDQVIAVVRKRLPVTHPKLEMLIGDYATLPSMKESLVGDDIFISIGTTKNKTPDQDKYYEIDHDYPLLAATIAKENGAKGVFLVSAVGANADSKIFYIRTKGETERDIIALNFDHTHIFRPSMLMGDRKNENRPLEKFMIGLFSVINPLFMGNLQKYRGIKGEEVAKAMLNAAKKPAGKVQVYEWKEMKELL